MVRDLFEPFRIYFHPKVIAIFFLGISSGLPLALVFSTLSTWMAEDGVSKTSIGIFAMVGLPYTVKFLWSPLVDQMKIPFMTKFFGRRVGWMLFTQILLILSIIALGFTSPSIDPLLTAIAALMVSFCSASQDIVIDAYRVEVLKEDEQAAGAAVIVFGYRIGMLITGAGALMLAHYMSWSFTYFIMSLFVLIGIVTVLFSGEPAASAKQKEEKDQDLAAWGKKAVIDPFYNFMQKPDWWIILLFITFYKFGDAFAGVMTYPFIIDIGFSKLEIASYVKTFGLVATIIGAFLGSYIVGKIGTIQSLWVCGILQMVSNLMFVILAKVGYNVELLAVTIAVENLSAGMGTTAFVVYISGLCNISYTATQYALLSSLASVGRIILSSSSGWFVDQIGWVNFFLLSTAFAIPGLFILLYIMKGEKGRASS